MDKTAVPSYYRDIMEKIHRAIFFWTLTLIFVIITPAIVLYARGFRFDFNRGVFVHSGTISIQSNPQEVEITINGKESDSKTLNQINKSYNISGLIPDTYDLSVSADGYQTWSKKVEVHSGQASEFWNIVLAKNDYAKTAYDTPGIGKFFISPKNKNIIYTRENEGGLDADIFNTQTKQSTGTFNFPGWRFIAESRRENIEWSPDEDYIAVPVEKTVLENVGSETASETASGSEPGEETIRYAYFILDPNKKTSFNLNDLLGNADINYARWDPKDKNYLFYLSNNALYRTNINNIPDTVTIAQDVSSFDLSRTNVYYARMPHELVYKTNLDGSGEPIQLTSDFPEGITRNFRLVAYDDTRIAFLTRNKDLYIFNNGEFDLYSKKLGADIEGLQFSDDGKKLLYWTKNAMSVYYLRNWNVAPLRSENSIEDITRYSDEIKNIQWSKDYEHIIFSSGAQVKIIELDPTDHRNSMELLKTDSASPLVGYDHAQERLYFVDTQDSSTNLFSIVFPEPTPILGLYTPANE
ncbi:MAG: PEGA domain-containing protein [Candidatus Moranbacteria bacterium]|nr:PEGA domain-containing protein [Candidatus Moranbacteria bacterium]